MDKDQLLRKVKGQLFFKKRAGFLGPLICNVDFLWKSDIETAQTDGASISWNPEWFMTLDMETRIFVLAHEALHIGLLHLTRRGNRNPVLWNQACDYVVNNMLIKDDFICNTDHLYNPSFDGMTVEEVYNILDKLPKMSSPSMSNSGKGKPKAGQGKPKPLNGNDIQEPATSEQANAVVRKAIAAAQSAKMSNRAGDVPGETTLAIEKFLRPVLPWKTLLNNFFTAVSTYSRSFQRPSRRYLDPLMPGKIGNNGLEHLIYFLDISGSISDKEILRFNSEVKHIKETFKPKKLTLVTFDVKIRDIYVFNEHDTFEKIVVTGRGGTNLEEVVAMANKEMPTAVVIFSDMRVNIPATKIKCPSIWVCVNNPRRSLPYGKLIYLNED